MTLQLDPARKAELVAREAIHLECLHCGWIPMPPDGLVIDRVVRIVDHMAERHDWLLAFVAIAVASHDRRAAA